MKEEEAPPAVAPVDLSARVRDVAVQTEGWHFVAEASEAVADRLRAVLLEVILAVARGDYSATSEEEGKHLLQNLLKFSLDTCSSLLTQAEGPSSPEPSPPEPRILRAQTPPPPPREQWTPLEPEYFPAADRLTFPSGAAGGRSPWEGQSSLFARIHLDESRPPFSSSSSAVLLPPPPPPVPLSTHSPARATRSRSPLSLCIALDSLVTSVAAENLNARLSSPLNYDSESSSSHCSDSLVVDVSPHVAGATTDAAECEGGGGGSRRRVSRDDRILASLGIPYSAATIINCSMEEFNSILVNSGLREDQVNTCRDMRRRGKNKIAAQNCRKRKVDQISTLAEEVEGVRARKVGLLQERAFLAREQEAWLARLGRLEAHVLAALARKGRIGGGGPQEGLDLAAAAGRGGLMVSGQFCELTQSQQQQLVI